MFLDILLDAIIDTIKLFPFLFLSYLLIGVLNNKSRKSFENSIKNGGPLLGALLGVFPQCGFSAAVSGFYTEGLVSLGTLMSIYLSTSDEMIPIFLSQQVSVSFLSLVLGYKILYGALAGTLIDRISPTILSVKEHREGEQDNHHPLYHALIHSLKTLFFIFIVNMILNTCFEFIPGNKLESILANSSYYSVLLTSLVGLIPNCSASVIITELYLKGMLSKAAFMAGLLSGAGVGWLVLYRAGRNKKETLKILVLLYILGILGGVIFSLI